MGEVVNLRTARKRRVRAERETEAERQRAAHGRTRAEREGIEREAQRADRTLDGARRDTD